ncbi:MAG: hypothetical protein JSR27_02585 [Proteobacteria bacterium]|nr:hypothetical protein [Pseudomonadota bacterium]
MRNLLLAAAALLALAMWKHAHRPVAHGPGEIAPDIPLQRALDAPATPWREGSYSIKPLARFSITARVLSRADYRFDRGAALVPTDLALGWGRMSDSEVLKNIDISQSGRFFFWHVDTYEKLPIPEREIIESSANMHLIPADRRVEQAIERSRAGDVVSFEGYLVEADGADGSKWISSLTRSDSGAGACELVWVEDFTIAPRP